MGDPYRVAPARPNQSDERTMWSKLRHWFWGCLHVHSRPTTFRLSNGNGMVLHHCSGCGEIVQMDWYEGPTLEDRWP